MSPMQKVAFQQSLVSGHDALVNAAEEIVLQLKATVGYQLFT